MCNVSLTKINHQHGFTLLEALLTLFILTIGVLGVAGLQMQAMSSGSIAMQRTIVLIKTQELIERMRINQASIGSYAGTGVGANGNCNNGVIVCDGPTMAAHDLWMWRNDLLTLLPTLGATPIVVVPGATATAPATINLTVNWTMKTNQQASATQAQSYVVQVSI